MEKTQPLKSTEPATLESINILTWTLAVLMLCAAFFTVGFNMGFKHGAATTNKQWTQEMVKRNIGTVNEYGGFKFNEK